MTVRTDHAADATATAGMIVCPKCGRTSSADAVVCGRCWQTLRAEQTADARRVAGVLGAEQAQIGRQRRAREIAAIRLVLLVILVAFVTLKLNGPHPIPAPQSTARSVVAAQAAPAQWPSADGDIGRTRVTAAPSGLNGKITWRARLDSPITTQPVVSDQAVYVGVRNAALVALSLTDGHELWRAPVPGQLDAAPTLAGGRLYLPLRDGQIMAVDESDGHVIWTEGDGLSFGSSPLVADGVVYAAALGDVRAFDAETGRLLWRQPIEGRVSSPPGAALSANEVVVTTYDSATVYSRSNGTRTFFYKLRTPTHALVQGGQVFVTGENSVVAFGFEQRRPWWEGLRIAWVEAWLFGMAPRPPAPPARWVNGNNRSMLAPTLAEDVLVVASPDGKTHGYDVATGAERWIHAGRPPAAAPFTANDGVLLVESDALVLLDPATGAERARRVLDGEQLGAVTATTGGTYAVNHGDEVLALR